LLIAAAITLCLDLAFRPIDLGYPPLFWLLCVPLLIAVFSLAWSEDRSETLRSAIIYAEGLVAYLFVVRELSGVSAVRVMTFIKRYAYLLIIPGILLLLYVPGFAPQEEGLTETSGAYLSYYTRLSHPILGRSNNLATLLAFFAPLLLYWGHVRGDRRMTFAAFVALAAIFMTQSRGVLLAMLLVALLFGLFVASGRREGGSGLGRKVLVGISLGFIAIAVLYSLNPSTQEYFDGRLTLANVEDRSALAAESLEQIEARPLLGYGAGVSPGDVDVMASEGEWADVDVHNTYLQQVVYFGIPLGVGIAVALWALAAFFLSRRPNPLAGVVAYALTVQLVLFLFESSYEGTVLRVLFYLSIGLAVALLRAADAESADAESARTSRASPAGAGR
jgi:O-antigen ligase